MSRSPKRRAGPEVARVATGTVASRSPCHALGPPENGRRPLFTSPSTSITNVPDIEFAFLADAADARPGQKFSVLGGGIDRIGGQTFPLQHPHISLVIGLTVTAPEMRREHEVR